MVEDCSCRQEVYNLAGGKIRTWATSNHWRQHLMARLSDSTVREKAMPLINISPLQQPRSSLLFKSKVYEFGLLRVFLHF